MWHIKGISCHQLQLSSLEEKITADNFVRIIDNPERSRRAISCFLDKTKT